MMHILQKKTEFEVLIKIQTFLKPSLLKVNQM